MPKTILVLFLILLATACGTSAGEDPVGSGGAGASGGVGGGGAAGAGGTSGVGGTRYGECIIDSHCGAGEGCQEETGDSYCTKLCTVDDECPVQEQCVGSVPGTSNEPKCKDIGEHGLSGVCDLYNGDFGPNTCFTPAGGECLVDGDCGAGKGCKFEVGDSYCTKLCAADTECEPQKLCAGGGASVDPSCKEIGAHGVSGVCDMFNGNFGPNTCK